MSELQSLYTTMSTMVIEQGTVLDRIEANVFEANYNVREGKAQVEETLAKETSVRAKACIFCQLQAILVLVVLIAFKFS